MRRINRHFFPWLKKDSRSLSKKRQNGSWGNTWFVGGFFLVYQGKTPVRELFGGSQPMRDRKFGQLGGGMKIQNAHNLRPVKFDGFG